MEEKKKNTFKEDIKEFLIENIAPLLLALCGAFIALALGRYI